MKTIKRFFLLAFSTLFFANVHTVNAQVTIGSEIEPASGVLLELKEYADGSASKGFKLPKVQLISLTDLAPCVSSASDTEKEYYKGLQVYNITTDASIGLAEGVYTWDGSKWKAVDNPILNLSDITVTRNRTGSTTQNGDFSLDGATFTITESGIYFFKARISISSAGNTVADLELKTASGTKLSIITGFVIPASIHGGVSGSDILYLSPGTYSIGVRCQSAVSYNVNWDYSSYQVKRLHF